MNGSPLYKHFETKPCGRCGGSGLYSFCTAYGNTCFQCGFKAYVPGTGWRLTKGSLPALAAWTTRNTVTLPAAELKAGDTWCPYGDHRRVTVHDVEILPEDKWLRGSWSSGVVGTATYQHGETITDMIVVTKMADGQAVHNYKCSASEATIWTGTYPLPPEMEPGTKRAKEMKAYVATAEENK